MNCKEEFELHVKGNDVLCAEIMYGDDGYMTYCLPVGYSHKQYQLFLESLNFEYDNGYGAQVVFGIIWYKDGSWSNRGEYDGSEWWSHQMCPQIPESLKSKDITL